MLRPFRAAAQPCRLLSREADVLPSLGAHLHVTLSAGTQSGIRYATSVLLSMFSAGSRPGSQSAAAVALFEAGRALLSGCTCLCKAVSVSPTALLHHCQAAQLLHACGNQCVAASAASKGPGSDEHLEIALGQLHSYSQIMGLACSLQLGQLRTDPAAVSAAFPPAVVLPWLASVGEALLAGLQRDPGAFRCASWHCNVRLDFRVPGWYGGAGCKANLVNTPGHDT